ncbi:hypothetical protein SAMN05660209_01328 [Geodermatophilus africanus]|uniref:Sporulation and spore germination n=1 Tax=Geodermatophilus africanus TaxID=1137993 RepID=A0A1H3EQQ6_9ACTN|nr:hypothetical protein [Geodermatophilus africanus]SDX81051.1 hypothetical protein SAMN05660209_01328 [Geodermatophilus africanus]
MRRVPLGPALALLVLVAGCAGGGDSAAPRPAPVSDGPGRLVLEVAHVGGFTTPEALAARVPLVAVYGDGRVVTPGAQIEIYPPPALPPLQVWRLDAEGVQTVVDRAVTAGVTGTADLGTPPVADVPATRFTLVTDQGTSVREVEALVELPGDSGLTPEQQAARDELRGLLEVLTYPEPLGATGPEPFEPTAVAAVVAPWTPPPDPGLVQAEAPWPGPALPGEPLRGGLGLSCVVARGEESGAVLAAAASATTLTPWVAGDGSRWLLMLRPLLPHETGCADLGD